MSAPMSIVNIGNGVQVELTANELLVDLTIKAGWFIKRQPLDPAIAHMLARELERIACIADARRLALGVVA
jgi:pantothenate kinase-related protein Tda10